MTNCALTIASCAFLLLEPLAGSERDEERLAFFEQEIRPALIEYCIDCHGVDTEASGGLLLDSRDGWSAGGDSGAALVPGKPDESRIFQALSYEDPDLQMPPDGRMPAEVIKSFRIWIETGATDPRKGSAPALKASSGLPVERAQEHWAYRPIRSQIEAAPDVDGNSIDHFVERKLRDAGLTAADRAADADLIRRLSYDLTGLPPTVRQLSNADRINTAAGYDKFVEELLESPAFGEHFARKWMDVARYAESITLRGFVLPEAWRYRDYLIDAYQEDRPFDQLIREQIAGDLLEADSLDDRRGQLIATAFLAMGNTNLERQDKTQLEMDVIDEQLEVIGRAFLGQTFGCARCHDHKFDPVPTRDYYALAGLLRSTQVLEHDNVSKWIDRPLPMDEAPRRAHERLVSKAETLERKVNQLKKRVGKLAQADDRLIPVETLDGIVVDSVDAGLVGQWKHSTFIGRIVGEGYLHDEDEKKGAKTATFEPANLEPGLYDVRIAYTASENRSSKTQVSVFCADGEFQHSVNQRQAPTEDGLWHSLGEFRFEEDGQAYVLISNAGSDGYVIVDAVQFLSASHADETNRTSKPVDDATELANLKLELEPLELQLKKLNQQIQDRPRHLGVVEQDAAIDVAVHVRGDVHNLGELVPRGVATAFGEVPGSETPRDRRALAQWIASPGNPLTARVYANRIWLWLMGQGLVDSPNNFGTTGQAPSHPELLDWLAIELIESGWSTKHLVRLIVSSDTYQRSIVAADPHAEGVDPGNRLYWSGTQRRLEVEALRDAMLLVSGELDRARHGSLIRSGTKSDYDYQHESTRRSIYHPVFRNSPPPLFEAFDFADASISSGKRSRSTVATQALVLMNHPWVIARSKAAAQRIANSLKNSDLGTDSVLDRIDEFYLEAVGRRLDDAERQLCIHHFEGVTEEDIVARLEQLVHAVFASIDFRFLN